MVKLKACPLGYCNGVGDNHPEKCEFYPKNKPKKAIWEKYKSLCKINPFSKKMGR